MFPITDWVDMFPRNYDINLINSTHVETFVVYDVSADNKDADILFEGAREKGIKVVIPDNSMKIRNRILKVRRDAR